MHQTRHSGASIDRVRGFIGYGQSSRLAADYHSLPRPLRDKREALALRVEVLSTRHEVWSQDVSDEKWSQERFHLHDNTLLAPQIYSASAAIANLLHRARMLGLWRFFVFFSHEHVDSSGSHRVARRCSGTGGRCCVSGQKHVHPKAYTSRSECCSSRSLTRPHRLSFTLAMILTMDARRFQRTHLLSGMGSSLNASKDIGMGVVDLALALWIVTSSWCSVYCSAWLSSHWSRTWRRLCSRGQIFRRMLRWQHTKVTI